MPSNPKSSVKYPSSINFVQFPVFALAWHSSPLENSICSVLAYGGGGGSAKTGVKNAIHVEITTTTQDGIDLKRNLSIDTGDSIGVSLAILRRPVWSWTESSTTDHRQDPFELWIAAGVGDDVRLYSIPLMDPNHAVDDFTLLTGFSFPKASHAGVNTVAVNPFGNLVAVGCESGLVSICALECKHSLDGSSSTSYQLMKRIDLTGHIKAVCSVRFHPRSDTIVLSSAKDGTCRLWDIQAETCLDVMSCKIYDPKLNPPTNPSILNPNPGQLLVRGCAFGDVEGRKIYTIQSGRKGQAFLSVWVLQILPPQQEQEPLTQDSGTTSSLKPSPPPRITFQEVSRSPVSQYPISAVDISGDFSMLVLGDTNGSVTLFSTSTLKPIQCWESVHDLPVTCVAARPLRQPLLPLPGERMTGIRVDALSVSADNKLTSLTLLRKATTTTSSNVKQGKDTRTGAWSLLMHLFVILAILVLGAKISYDTCEELFISDRPWSDALDCIIHDVWWAPKDRPGISFVPH